MIVIDRQSSVPVHEQLVEQLRFLLASGHFKIGDPLPATRVLANQLGISFHTVRKAYQQLEQENRVTAKVGSGYRVKEKAPTFKAERIEQGAAIVKDTLHKLIGLGLDETELDYLFQEQMDLLSTEAVKAQVVFFSTSKELADTCAEQVALALQRHVEPVTPEKRKALQEADYVIARFGDFHQVLQTTPDAELVGVVTHLNLDVLEKVTRLYAHQTLGLVCRHAETISPLTADIRSLTGFSGPILATSIDEEARHLETFIEQCTLLAYTPACRRRLLPLLTPDRHQVMIQPLISRESMEQILQAVPH